MQRHFWLFLIGAWTLVLAGCGGGGGDDGGGTVTRTAPVTVGVNWAERSRVVNAPASALSVVVTIPNGALSGGNITQTVNRNPAPAAYNQTITLSNVTVGTKTVQIRFFAQADGAGSLVGTADATVNVTGSGTVDVGNVATTSTIASVALTTNPTVEVGQSNALNVTARDANNNIVAVTPGSIRYTLTETGGNAGITNDQIQGFLAGTVNVTATVDGVTSAPASVAVLPKITGLVAEENGFLAGVVRARVRGIAANATPTSVTVGGQNATVVGNLATADPDPNTLGGAVSFRVPTGLNAGAQNLVVTVNGQASAPITVNVTDTNPYATFTLDGGQKFVIRLRRDKAPITVDNFVGLATGTKTWTPTYATAGGPVAAGPEQNTPLYDGVIFHRVTDLDPSNTPQGIAAVKIIQAGDPITKQTNPPAGWSAGTGGPGFTIPFEVNDLTHEDGTIAMARTAALNTAGSQFFINDGPQPFLNTTTNGSGQATGGYVVFGQIVEGLANAKGITQGTRLTSVTISGAITLP